MIGTIVFCRLTQKGPCGMTVNNDIDDDMRGLAFHLELNDVGKTQVDWQRGNVHCVLIQHL